MRFIYQAFLTQVHIKKNKFLIISFQRNSNEREKIFRKNREFFQF